MTADPRLHPHAPRIRALLAEHGPMTVVALAAAAKITNNQARKSVHALQRRGGVHVVGYTPRDGKASPSGIYGLTPPASLPMHVRAVCALPPLAGVVRAWVAEARA